jgi:hypothetical protein
VANSIRTASSYVTDKKQLWADLIKLTRHTDSNIRYASTILLGSAFPHIQDKKQAGEDLHDLIKSGDSQVRNGLAISLGSAFPYVPNKQQILEDLNLLKEDEAYATCNANYSLGKIFVFEASQANTEEEYKNKLEQAISYFEKSTEEAKSNEFILFNPSYFCLPFYRSFYSTVFKEQTKAIEEVEKFLSETKSGIGNSKSKKLLFEVAKSLADTLKEVQDMENIDLETIKGKISFYRAYFDRTEELMRGAEQTAPFAVATVRKGLPFLEIKLESLLEEIQEKAKTACRESQGTPTAEIACAVSREVQKWEIGSQEEMTLKVEDIAYLLKTKVANLPENEYVMNKIETMKYEGNLTKQYETLLFVIGQIPTMKVVSEQELDHKLHKLDLVYDKTVIIEDKLSCISYGIFKIKLNSHNVISNLEAMKKEMEKLNETKILNPSSLEKLNSVQVDKLNDLNKDILERLKEIRTLIDELPKNNETQKIIDSLNELRQSDSDMLLQRSSEITSLIGFIIQVIQLYIQYKPA